MAPTVFIAIVFLFALANAQECKRKCNVLRINPVCASNGMTFMNECLMQRWACRRGVSLSVEMFGPCRMANVQQQPQQLAGSDSSEEDDDSSEEKPAPWPPVNPPNPSITTGLPGPAEVTTFKPMELGTMPVTREGFGDYDMFTDEAITEELITTGKTASVTPCNMTCPLVLDIVCGTDGVTYQSRCVLEAEACRMGDPTITVAYAGPCVSTSSPNGDLVP